jgi:hypothetical protein
MRWIQWGQSKRVLMHRSLRSVLGCRQAAGVEPRQMVRRMLRVAAPLDWRRRRQQKVMALIEPGSLALRDPGMVMWRVVVDVG